jgi:hypothetical protein
MGQASRQAGKIQVGASILGGDTAGTAGIQAFSLIFAV